ncbi:dystroglycan isoform X3 [Drosophila obscura]|uniref:dystroglycan isoform X3 n=1 Tax=Drosophila obscura TaxID=7282 RepID=UPI001BB28D4D|nr:dystroglycan isoform X3 [Drosophila obscura]
MRLVLVLTMMMGIMWSFRPLGAVPGKFQENNVDTTTAAATTATTAMPGPATDMVKSTYLEKESGNQVDAVAVVDVDAALTLSTADNTTPPPISGSVSADTQHSSSSSNQKPFSPYDATSSVSVSSSASSSVVPSIEAVETSSLPSMSTSASTTGTSSSPSSSPSSHIVANTGIVLDRNNNNNNTLTTSSSSSSATTTTITPTATMSTTTPATTTTTTLFEMSPKPHVNDFELSSYPPVEDNEDATTIPTTAAAAAAATITARTSSSSEIDAHVVESTATHRTISSKEGEADAISTPNNNSSGGGGSLANNEQLLPGSSVPPSTVATTTRATPEATSTVSTFASTDYVEPQPENSVPIIKTRLQKLAVTSGKAFTMIVPEDTFWDAEDQGNLRLELTDKDGHELKSNSWLQFNADKRELYGLPLDDTVSRWQYRLSATDSGNATVTETVEISVQQHRAVRTINHEISVVVKINGKSGHNIDWQLKLINALARTLDDDNSSAVVVREIRPTPLDPHSAIFVYFNETLPTSDCPEKELSELVSRLDAQRLSDLVQPLLAIKSITGQLIGSCQKDLTKVKPTMQMAKNVPPMPRNQVDRVNASVGQLLVFKVPPDTFYDANDNDLTLTLKSKEHKELGTRHWLQFDSKNQEFYGIPKGGDTGSEEYLLVAEDSGGLSAHDALVVVVSHPPKKEFGAFFKAYLSIRHENFNAELQRKFVERIAKVNGDANTNQIQIRSINIHHDSDGTIVNFYNTSLYKHHNRCPEKELAATRSVYLAGDSLRDSVKRAMGPELNLTNFSVAPFGSCHHSENIDINQHELVPTRPEEPSQKSTFSEEYLANFILPAVIILVMIVLASIVACCLHRRRHKSGKMELGDEEERKSFRAKGIPVIFQDEYEEKPEIGNKSPVILKDEKPPLLPPSYNTSNMNGDNDVDEYVPPPAVVVGGREVRGKSPATPSYRKPPPYVSP